MSAERYKVRIDRDDLAFCCGHFITFDGGQCEPLHGHNFRAAIELEGALDANGYVFDFIALMKHAKAVTGELDHHVLLPSNSQHIPVETKGERVEVRCKEREWVFPRADCLILPIENTTAELVARHIGMRLLDALQREHRFTPEVLRIEVEEGVGQFATWEWHR